MAHTLPLIRGAGHIIQKETAMNHDEPRTIWDEAKPIQYDKRAYTEMEDNNIELAKKAKGGKKNYPFDDTGNANRFVDRYGDEFRYNVDDRCWMIYDGNIWHKDTKQEIKQYADALIEHMRYDLRTMEVTDDNSYAGEYYRNIKRLSSSSGKDAMLKEVVHLNKVAVTNREFDRELDFINCKNGVVNLRTGEITEHDRTRMMSKSTRIDCDMFGEPKRWLKFLDEVFQGNREVIDYVQCIVGYSLTGYTVEQCMFQLCGNGSNGKSVFLNTIQSIMGDYAVSLRTETITAKQFSSSGNATPEIAKMNGARLICTNEPDEGARMNEGFLKGLVAGDSIVARNLYGSEFEFTPIGKLWITTNYKLTIRGTDKGIWRRQRLIPFKREFSGNEVDKYLSEKLMKEYPQILGWAVRGAIKYFRGEMKTPAIVDDAVREYKVEMDVVASFLKDNIRITPNGREKAGDVYKAYAQWCKIGNEYKMSMSKFGTEMSKRYDKKQIAGYYYYIGFVLKCNDTSYIYDKEDV